MAIDDEVKYRTLIETAPDAIFLVDLETGRIREVNERATELLGYDESELVDRSVETIHPEEDIDRYERKFQETVEQESIQFSRFDDGTQIYVVTTDGERIPVDIRATVVQGAAGPVLFSVVRDISEITRYEREVERLAGELAVVNRLIRHDIRNDMTVILGWLEQLKSELGDAHQGVLSRLLRKSRAVVELTDNVKDYVEMLESDADIHLESVLLGDVVETEADAISQAYDAVEISTPDFPTQPVVANSMLASVFRNLFHNAVQHNDKPTPEIEVTTEDLGERIVVHVADNGPGIDDDRKEAIFGKGDKGLESSGTGIGLFLIGELVDTFGGEVWISDNDPEGTVFSIELRKA